MSRTFYIAIIAALVSYAAVMTLMFWKQGEIIDSMLRCVISSGTTA